LYEHTEVENLKTFETIEREVREQMLEKVTPQIGEFFFQKGGEKEGGSKEV
jgi:hemerythrin-like domain-containing protein